MQDFDFQSFAAGQQFGRNMAQLMQTGAMGMQPAGSVGVETNAAASQAGSDFGSNLMKSVKNYGMAAGGDGGGAASAAGSDAASSMMSDL